MQAVPLADRHHGVERRAASARLPHSSAARSISGKLLCRVSCHTRISNCANCRPGGAGLRQQLGQRVLQQFVREQERRFQRHGLQTAALARRGSRLDLGVLIEKPARILAENARQHVQHLGGRHALAGLDHAQIGHRGAPAASICTQRADNSSRVRPLRLRRERSLVPEKMPLPDQARHTSPRCEIHTVKFLMCKSALADTLSCAQSRDASTSHCTEENRH